MNDIERFADRVVGIEANFSYVLESGTRWDTAGRNRCGAEMEETITRTQRDTTGHNRRGAKIEETITGTQRDTTAVEPKSRKQTAVI